MQLIPGMGKHVRVKFQYWHLLRGCHRKRRPEGKMRREAPTGNERPSASDTREEGWKKAREELQVQSKQQTPRGLESQSLRLKEQVSGPRGNVAAT